MDLNNMTIGELTEKLSGNIEKALKGLNGIGNKDLSREALDLITQAKAGKLNQEQVLEIGKKMIQKYAS